MAPRHTPPQALEVCVEATSTRAFASALDWPGWCRSGRDEATAVRALAEYAARFAPVAVAAGLHLPRDAAMSVVESVPGNATTGYGAPAVAATAERVSLTDAEARRRAALVAASWATLDEIVGGAPASLRKGPRGGGRDRDAVVAHVLAAETAYARKLGPRFKEPAAGDTAAVAEARAAIIEVLERARDGEPLVERGWLPRYAARRIAWHVLDHAWEIEDRSTP